MAATFPCCAPNYWYPSFPSSLPHDDSSHNHGTDAYQVPGAGGTLQLQPAEPCEQFDMLPPQPSMHASWQALHDYAQSYASEHGYALSINSTARTRSRIKLTCVCFGQPKNTHELTAETRARKNTASYKTGCKMWIEGKKQEAGTWILRVGEPLHNHAGRPSQDWAIQRTRNWELVGEQKGTGGVTAKEEMTRVDHSQADKDDDDDDGADNESADNESAGGHGASQTASHSLERDGLVWSIVEQEMLRKGKPINDREQGVDRTIQVLQARLPGIRILKNDVYNLRAQIKRARKATGLHSAHVVDSEDENTNADPDASEHATDDDDDAEEEEDKDSANEAPMQALAPPPSNMQLRTAPMAVHTPDSALDPPLPQMPKTLADSTPSHQVLSASHTELEQLRRENAQLKGMLLEKTNEVKEKNIEIVGLRSQLEYMTRMTMLPS